MSVDARVGVTEVLGDMAQVVDSGSHRSTCDGVTWVPLKTLDTLDTDFN